MVHRKAPIHGPMMGTNSGRGPAPARSTAARPAGCVPSSRRGCAGDPRRAPGGRLAAAAIALAGRRPGGLATAGRGLLRPAAGRGLPDGAGGSRDVRGRRRAQRRRRARRRRPPRALRYDFFPGSPDLAGFPRRAWLRAHARGPARGARQRARLPRPARRAGAAAGARRAPAPRARGRRRREHRARVLGGRAGAHAAGARARRRPARSPWRIRGCRCTARSWPPPAPR